MPNVACKSETLTCRFCGHSYTGMWEKTNRARVCVRCGKDNGMGTTPDVVTENKGEPASEPTMKKPKRKRSPKVHVKTVDDISERVARAVKRVSPKPVKKKPEPKPPQPGQRGSGVYRPDTPNGLMQKLILAGKARKVVITTVLRKYPDRRDRVVRDYAWNRHYLKKRGFISE